MPENGRRIQSFLLSTADRSASLSRMAGTYGYSSTSATSRTQPSQIQNSAIPTYRHKSNTLEQHLLTFRVMFDAERPFQIDLMPRIPLTILDNLDDSLVSTNTPFRFILVVCLFCFPWLEPSKEGAKQDDAANGDHSKRLTKSLARRSCRTAALGSSLSYCKKSFFRHCNPCGDLVVMAWYEVECSVTWTLTMAVIVCE